MKYRNNILNKFQHSNPYDYCQESYIAGLSKGNEIPFYPMYKNMWKYLSKNEFGRCNYLRANWFSYRSVCPACGEVGSSTKYIIGYCQYMECFHCRTLYISPYIEQKYFKNVTENIVLKTICADVENISLLNKYFSHRCVKDLKILDYGYGYGATIMSLIENGYNPKGIYGYDIRKTKKYVEMCIQNKYPHIGQWSNLQNSDSVLGSFGQQKYDIIFMSSVIEHLLNPVEVLQNVRQLMHNSSLIFLTQVPALSCKLARISEGAYKHFTSPTHYNIYSIEGISILMKRSGMKIMKANLLANKKINIDKESCFLRTYYCNGKKIFLGNEIQDEQMKTIAQRKHDIFRMSLDQNISDSETKKVIQNIIFKNHNCELGDYKYIKSDIENNYIISKI